MKYSSLLLGLLLFCSGLFAQERLSLEGTWDFKLLGKGEAGSTIYLPGTTDMAGYGVNPPKVALQNQWTFGWKRPKVYEGKAEYGRSVTIPESWRGKHIELYLEQTRSSTTVRVDGQEVPGTEESLVTAHRHNLSAFLTPGKHYITLLLDNSQKHGIGGSYVRSSMGQGNWQGVTGRIELRMTDPVWIESTTFTPLDKQHAVLEVHTGGGEGKLFTEVEVLDDGKRIAQARAEGKQVKLDISQLELWDEFHPKCYTLKTRIVSGQFSDEKTEQIGIRFVGTTPSHQFTVNDRPIFLRGTVSYSIFPLTGYPSTDESEWEKMFGVFKEWGMNHVRFHSQTPPEAALNVADRMGIYLQCEAPKAGKCGKEDEDAFQIAEGRRLIRDYGNHPSWIMMSMGNELGGEIAAIQHVLDAVRENDSRRLYTSTTGNSKQELQDDYKIYGGIVRGFKGPFTDWDYSEKAKEIDRTMLSHEVGQWHAYPDLRQIDKYTGVMQCDNLLIIRDDLRRKGMEDRAADFTRTSGKFQSLLYKDEMEAIERTPNYGGFQILTLPDFPAQGTATSGMLDIFNEPKGYLDAERFREYCAPLVPLLRLPKRTYLNSEMLEAGVDLNCYLPEDLRNVTLRWTLSDSTQIYASGKIPCAHVPTGNVHHVGSIRAPLSGIASAAALELKVELEGTPYRNRWNIWVYPDAPGRTPPADVFIERSWMKARERLLRGEKVLLFPSVQELALWRPGQFKTIFWSPVWLKRGPETMSIAVDTLHPLMRAFPTERHTDWQWFDILEHSITFNIDALPRDFEPIVGMIDSYRKNERLANMLEAQVGEGKLLMVGLDLLKDVTEPSRAALRNALYAYLSSDSFQPVSVPVASIDSLFKKCIVQGEAPAGDLKLDLSADGTHHYMAKGYGAKIQAKVQVSGVITAWADKRDLDITLTLPKGSRGKVYLYMRNSKSSRWGMLKTPQEISGVDWVEETFENYGNKLPAACIMLGDKDLGTISHFGNEGQWYSFPLTSEDTVTGIVKLSICTFNFPNILCSLAISDQL